MSESETCVGCKDAYEEIRKMEDKQDRFHEEYIAKVHQYDIDKVEDKASLKAIHKRIDTMAEDNKEMKDSFVSHMKEEIIQHSLTNDSLSKLLAHQEHNATKEELEVEKGRISTLFKLGLFAFAVISSAGGLFLWYVKWDINNHTTKSSIINAKVIEKKMKDK